MTQPAFQLGVARLRDGQALRGLRAWHVAVALLALAASLAAAAARSSALGAPSTALAALVDYAPFILRGFALNLGMSFLAMAIATVLGIGLGLLQISTRAVVRLPARFVTHLLRNSPWLVILFLVTYFLPVEVRLPGGWRVPVPDWSKATLAFALPVMGNISEILRGAVRSIPSGQWESAEGLAFTRGQILRYVVLPQCVRRCIPPWMNWYALLTLSTPMASIFGVHEAVANAQASMEAAGARPELLLPFYLFLLCLFFVYIYPIAVWTRVLERRYAVG